MDLGQLDIYAQKMIVDLIDFNNELIYVGSVVPNFLIIGHKPTSMPILRSTGAGEDGYAIWVTGKAIVVNEQEYPINPGEALMAKINKFGVFPLVRTASMEICLTTGHTRWPIITSMTRT